MPQLYLTEIAIRALKPSSQQVDYWDTTTPGFGIRVGVKAKTYIAKHNNRRHTIGRFPEMKLTDARKAAKKLMLDPPPPGSSLTFQDAYGLFLTTHCADVRPATKREYENTLKRHFLGPWGAARLSDIAPNEVVSIVADLADRPSEAFHAFAVARTFFLWAVSMRYITISPLYGVRAPRAVASRTRVLSDRELVAVFRAAQTDGAAMFGKFVALLILTGQRKSQIGKLHAGYIDRERKTITWPAALMKGKRQHTIPYGPVAASIVETLPEAGLLFPSEKPETPMSGFTKRKNEFDELCGVADYTLHDLRRTMRSGLAALKTPPHIGERILDHRSAVASEVEAIYDRYLYMDEMRAAVEKWEEHLLGLVAR